MTKRTSAANAAPLSLEDLGLRTALAGASAAAVLAAIGTPAPAADGVLALRPRWLAAHEAVEAAIRKPGPDGTFPEMTREEVTRQETKLHTACEAEDAAIRAVGAIPARTLTDLGFKAHILASAESDVDYPDLVASILVDVAAFAVAHPTVRLCAEEREGGKDAALLALRGARISAEAELAAAFHDIKVRGIPGATPRSDVAFAVKTAVAKCIFASPARTLDGVLFKQGVLKEWAGCEEEWDFLASIEADVAALEEAGRSPPQTKRWCNVPSFVHDQAFRAFNVVDHVPPGCIGVIVTREDFDPHLRHAEVAIVDTADQEPQHGELYAVALVTIEKSPRDRVAGDRSGLPA